MYEENKEEQEKVQETSQETVQQTEEVIQEAQETAQETVQQEEVIQEATQETVQQEAQEKTQQPVQENETPLTDSADESNIYRFTKKELEEKVTRVSGDYNHTQNIWTPQPDGAQGDKEGKSKKNKKAKKHTGKKVVKFVASAVAFGAIAFGAFLGANYVKDKCFPNTNRQIEIATTNTGNSNVSVTTTSTSNQTGSNTTTVTDVSGVVSEVMPSIVAITSTQYIETGNYGYFWGNSGNSTYEAEGAGSGIILAKNDTELLIVTNEHVVADADTLSVQFADGASVDAYTKGTDSDADLAIVSVPLEKIKSETFEAIKIATIGDSDAVKVGEGAIAIGNALGYGQSVTTGVISAVDREVSSDENSDPKKLLQTDAAINPGNSGGALLNMKGEVIGINELKYSSDDVEGMGFAIPISSATEIINVLMNQETKTKVDEDKRGYLGIVGFDVDSQIAQTYGLEEGVFIESVLEGGAAEKAGLEAKDIIVKLNGVNVKEMEDLQKQLQYYAVGDTVTVTVKYADGKEYKEKDVEVTLGEQIESAGTTSGSKSNGNNRNNSNGNGSSSDDFFNYFGW